jgi:hypothetical protein
MDYVMELCETCHEPIGYVPFMTEGNGEHPVHADCFNKSDLKKIGYGPVRISLPQK